MNSTPGFDEVFAVMTAASDGDMSARVSLKEDPDTKDPAIRFAIALNELLDHFSQRSVELRDSESRKSAILRSAFDAIVSMDHKGLIVEFNPAAEIMFGRTRAEVVGEPMAETIIPPSLRERHIQSLARYLETGSGSVIGKWIQITGMRADGSEFPVELAITRVELPGAPLFTGYLRDVTERERADEELKLSFETLQRSDEKRRTLLAHLLKAQEEERKRIASDVHDDSIQVMAAVGVRLGMLRGRITDTSQLGWITKLEEAVQISIGRLRHLLFQLAPPALELGGLAAAIRTYLDEAFDEADVEYTVESLLSLEPASEIRTLVYRIAQEALSNVRKHAQAGRVDVRLEDKDGGLFVSIHDDGVGYSPTESETPELGHLGLLSMRERAEMLGGWFKITGIPNHGTSLEFWVPPQAPVEDRPQRLSQEQLAGVVA
jgi:PAS domain S-box-containing protein